MIIAVFLVACKAVPEDSLKVIPGDLETSVLTSSSENWGQSLTVADGVIWAGSEPGGLVESSEGEVVGGAWAGRGQWLGEIGGELRIGIAGIGIFDETGQEIESAPDSRAFAGDGENWAIASSSSVRTSDGREWAVSDPRKVAISGQRVAALSCVSGTCDVLELGNEVQLLGPGEAGGDLAFYQEVLWWGLPDLQEELGEGRVVSEHQEEIWGLPGDHLGRSIGGGYAGGSMNGNQVPRVLRLVPIAGSTVLGVDRSAGSLGVGLFGLGDDLLVGIPGWVEEGGAVLVVGLEEAP